MSALTNPLTGEPIPDEEIQGLADLIDRQLKLEDRIEEGKKLLAQLGTKLTEVSNKLIPDKMDQLGFKALCLSNGRKVEIKPFYGCKLLDGAFRWLDNNGHGGLIKTTVERKFNRDQRSEAIEFVKANTGFELSEEIHHQTLNAFTREIYSNNESLPEEYFQVFQGSKTKIS